MCTSSLLSVAPFECTTYFSGVFSVDQVRMRYACVSVALSAIATGDATVVCWAPVLFLSCTTCLVVPQDNIGRILLVHIASPVALTPVNISVKFWLHIVNKCLQQ